MTNRRAIFLSVLLPLLMTGCDLELNVEDAGLGGEDEYGGEGDPADPNEPPPPEPTQPRAPALAARFSMKAVTIGIDDTRDRSTLRSPLLLVVIPKLPFLTSKSAIDCTQKL